MPSQRRHFRLPAFGTSFRRTFRQKFCFWHHKRCTVAPSTYSQGWEDTATTEVEPADKYQSPAGSSGATQSSNAIHQYHGQCSTAPPGQVQGPEDATTPEAGPHACFVFCASSHQIPAPSLELENRAVASVGHFRRLWRGVRDRKNRVGLVEIDNNNEYYIITKMIQAGLWAASQVSIDNPPKGPATLKEFAEVRTQVHKEGFQLQILAGPAFARLRKRVGVTEQDYQAALGPGNPYLQFISTSKSKASFFLSHDQRFFLKTQTRKEVQVLLSQLYSYVQHLVQYPHSLLAKLLGIYSLRVANRAKKYFIVIENIFYPVSRISERYDIKACTLSRWVEPVPEDSPLLLVLKDLNFDGKTIDLGPQRSWFLRQIKVDIEFLRGHGVLDYSLLVGIQPLHEDEKNRFSFVRTIRSVYGGPEGQNRRLLPDVPNALHVLDGPEKRYFLGLVDVTTIFGFRKRMEQLWKTIRHPGQSFSTVSPDHYARRMIQWVETHTK